MVIDGIRGAHSEYHWLPPNHERSCHIVSSSLDVGGLPLACPLDAEDAHTAIFVFVVVVFTAVFIVVIFVVVIHGRRAWGPRGREMDATLPPPTPPLLDDYDAPPPGGGCRITRGWTGDPRLLTLPPGPQGRRGGTASLAPSTPSSSSLSPSLLSSSSSPPPQLALWLLTPTAPQLPPHPNPGQSMPIKLSSLALCTMMPNHRAANEGRAGATNNRGDEDGAPSASCDNGGDGVASLRQQSCLHPRLPTTTGGIVIDVFVTATRRMTMTDEDGAIVGGRRQQR